ncbi:MAG: hypothetical protein GF414_08620, partial [Candidatus Altiarchaeales archaeon]|nr:hypothetical protein [Candidatus Altiarchaeales archaeon]
MQKHGTTQIRNQTGTRAGGAVIDKQFDFIGGAERGGMQASNFAGQQVSGREAVAQIVSEACASMGMDVSAMDGISFMSVSKSSSVGRNINRDGKVVMINMPAIKDMANNVTAKRGLDAGQKQSFINTMVRSVVAHELQHIVNGVDNEMALTAQDVGTIAQGMKQAGIATNAREFMDVMDAAGMTSAAQAVSGVREEGQVIGQGHAMAFSQVLDAVAGNSAMMGSLMTGDMQISAMQQGAVQINASHNVSADALAGAVNTLAGQGVVMGAMAMSNTHGVTARIQASNIGSQAAVNIKNAVTEAGAINNTEQFAAAVNNVRNVAGNNGVNLASMTADIQGVNMTAMADNTVRMTQKGVTADVRAAEGAVNTQAMGMVTGALKAVNAATGMENKVAAFNNALSQSQLRNAVSNLSAGIAENVSMSANMNTAGQLTGVNLAHVDGFNANMRTVNNNVNAQAAEAVVNTMNAVNSATGMENKAAAFNNALGQFSQSQIRGAVNNITADVGMGAAITANMNAAGEVASARITGQQGFSANLKAGAAGMALAGTVMNAMNAVNSAAGLENKVAALNNALSQTQLRSAVSDVTAGIGMGMTMSANMNTAGDVTGAQIRTADGSSANVRTSYNMVKADTARAAMDAMSVIDAVQGAANKASAFNNALSQQQIRSGVTGLSVNMGQGMAMTATNINNKGAENVNITGPNGFNAAMRITDGAVNTSAAGAVTDAMNAVNSATGTRGKIEAFANAVSQSSVRSNLNNVTANIGQGMTVTANVNAANNTVADMNITNQAGVNAAMQVQSAQIDTAGASTAANILAGTKNSIDSMAIAASQMRNAGGNVANSVLSAGMMHNNANINVSADLATGLANVANIDTGANLSMQQAAGEINSGAMNAAADVMAGMQNSMDSVAQAASNLADIGRTASITAQVRGVDVTVNADTTMSMGSAALMGDVMVGIGQTDLAANTSGLDSLVDAVSVASMAGSREELAKAIADVGAVAENNNIELTAAMVGSERQPGIGKPVMAQVGETAARTASDMGPAAVMGRAVQAASSGVDNVSQMAGSIRNKMQAVAASIRIESGKMTASMQEIGEQLKGLDMDIDVERDSSEVRDMAMQVAADADYPVLGSGQEEVFTKDGVKLHRTADGAFEFKFDSRTAKEHYQKGVLSLKDDIRNAVKEANMEALATVLAGWAIAKGYGENLFNFDSDTRQLVEQAIQDMTASQRLDLLRAVEKQLDGAMMRANEARKEAPQDVQEALAQASQQALRTVTAMVTELVRSGISERDFKRLADLEDKARRQEKLAEIEERMGEVVSEVAPEAEILAPGVPGVAMLAPEAPGAAKEAAPTAKADIASEKGVRAALQAQLAPSLTAEEQRRAAEEAQKVAAAVDMTYDQQMKMAQAAAEKIIGDRYRLDAADTGYVFVVTAQAVQADRKGFERLAKNFEALNAGEVQPRYQLYVTGEGAEAISGSMEGVNSCRPSAGELAGIIDAAMSGGREVTITGVTAGQEADGALFELLASNCRNLIIAEEGNIFGKV